MESQTILLNISDVSRKYPEGSELVIMKIRMTNDGTGKPKWTDRKRTICEGVYPFSDYEKLFGSAYTGEMKVDKPQAYMLDDFSDYTGYPFQEKYSVFPTLKDTGFGMWWTNFDVYHQDAPSKLLTEETTSSYVYLYTVALKLNLGTNVLQFESIKSLAFDDYGDKTECYIFGGVTEDHLSQLGYIRCGGTAETTEGCISRTVDDGNKNLWDYKEIGVSSPLTNNVQTVSDIYITCLDDAVSLSLIGFEITGKMVGNGSFDEVGHKQNVLSTLQNAVDELKTANSWLEQIAGK